MSIREESLVSIIIPVYKCEKYIEKCLQSVINQTYENVEIIVVLDGCADSSPALCKAAAEKDGRIVIIEQENSGVSAARNRGIDAAKGDWIMFVDGDDWIESDCVEVLVKQAESSGCDIVIARYFTEYQGQSVAGGYDADLGSGDTAVDRDSLILTCACAHSFIGVPWGKIYSGALLENRNIRFPLNVKIQEDVVFNLYAFRYSRATVMIQDCLYHYYRNDDSVTFKYSGDYDNNILLVMKEMESFIGKSDCSYLTDAMRDKTVLLLYEMIVRQYAHRECRLSRRDKLRQIRSIIENGEYPFKENIKKARLKCLKPHEKVLGILFKMKLYGIIYAYCEMKYKDMRGFNRL